MQITYVLELLKPTKNKQNIIESNIKESQLNRVSISQELLADNNKLSSKDFVENLPPVVINQNIREVKALYKLFKKSKSNKSNLTFKKNQPLCYNNQNFKIENGFISVPLMTDKSRMYWFPVVSNNRYKKLQEAINNGAKLGKSSLFNKNGKYYFAVTVSIDVASTLCNNIMGIDIGFNQLAVASIQNTSGIEVNRQFHNGKQAGFIRKKYKATRRMLGKTKNSKLIKALKDKESRYITDLNHKISRQLIDLAVQEKVSVIVMEDLKNIRKTAFFQERADKNLNSWAFFELQQFIEYKAKLAGIKVMYINPKYTSQTCSICGTISKSNRSRNLYSCSCGHKVHADLNAARNICSKGIQAVYQQSA